MATITTHTLTDDIDGTAPAEPVSFALDGVSYTIDLAEKNAAALREALAPFVANARRSNHGHGRRPQRRRSHEDAQAIRLWVRENGGTISDHGRIPAAYVDAYSNGDASALR